MSFHHLLCRVKVNLGRMKWSSLLFRDPELLSISPQILFICLPSRSREVLILLFHWELTGLFPIACLNLLCRNSYSLTQCCCHKIFFISIILLVIHKMQQSSLSRGTPPLDLRELPLYCTCTDGRRTKHVTDTSCHMIPDNFINS